jgi:NAD+ kinase
MSLPIRSVFILTKARHQQAEQLGRRIRDWLSARGVSARTGHNEEGEASLPVHGESVDLILVLGGDGTMLSVARKMGDHEIPLLGLNLGQVGFLTELSPEGWEDILDAVLKQEFTLSNRIVLRYHVLRGERLLDQGRVINDIVVGRGGMARLVRLRMWYDQVELANLRADGLIVSTPIGSTAYAVAAGGPLISPELEVMEISPVCPFLNAMRPLVMPSSGSFRMQVESPTTDVFLTLDGQSGYPLQPGDAVEVSEDEQRLHFVQPRQSAYIRKLKLKGYL